MSLSKPAFDSFASAVTETLLQFSFSLSRVVMDHCLTKSKHLCTLKNHSPTPFSSAVLFCYVQQAYASNIPVSSSALASEEANRISRQLSDAFFHVANLSCLGVFNSDGIEAFVAFAACYRTSNISFTKFQATVAPATFTSVLIDTPSSTVTCYLKLPQSMTPAKPSSSTAPADPHPAPAQDTNDGSLSTADTVNITAIRKAFANAGDPLPLDLTGPSILTALSSIIKTSTADNELDAIFTPGSAKRQLFASNSTPTIVHPSIC